jgi:hypothetical protein
VRVDGVTVKAPRICLTKYTAFKGYAKMRAYLATLGIQKSVTVSYTVQYAAHCIGLVTRTKGSAPKMEHPLRAVALQYRMIHAALCYLLLGWVDIHGWEKRS